jgi:hypothetical protein
MSKSSKNCLSDYQSFYPKWDKFASIRDRPRRLLSDCKDRGGYFYPVERQPLAIHPLVVAKGDDVVRQLLIHSAYKFMLDIAYVEVELINNTALKVYNGSIGYAFPENVRNDMLAIIVDEAYHAYVALDWVKQIREETRVEPFYETKEVELGYYMKKYLKKLSASDQHVFELIAICIGENTLTKELFSMTKQPNLNPFFHQIMADHMIDEGRHSSLFRLILRKTWSEISEEQRLSIGEILPDFILDYTSDELHNNFNIGLLKHLGFSSNEIEGVINDTRSLYSGAASIKRNPVIKNIVDMLNLLGVFEHQETRRKFEERNLVEVFA